MTTTTVPVSHTKTIPATNTTTTIMMTHVETEAVWDEHDEDLSLLPTVELGGDTTCQEVPTAQYTTNHENDSANMDVTSSETLALARAHPVAFSTSGSLSPNDLDEDDLLPAAEDLRAEYLSVTFWRPPHSATAQESLGLRLMNRRITYITPDSLAAKSPLRVGDQLLSINGKLLATTVGGDASLTADTITTMLQAPGTLVLVVHNRQPRYRHGHQLECMLTKSHPDDKIGLGLQRIIPAENSDPQLIISNVDPHKAAALSLLHSQDEIISINNIPARLFRSARDASDIIAQSPTTVTIRVRTTQAIVLGEERVVNPVELAVEEWLPPPVTDSIEEDTTAEEEEEEEHATPTEEEESSVPTEPSTNGNHDVAEEATPAATTTDSAGMDEEEATPTAPTPVPAILTTITNHHNNHKPPPLPPQSKLPLFSLPSTQQQQERLVRARETLRNRWQATATRELLQSTWQATADRLQSTPQQPQPRTRLPFTFLAAQ